jgi:hypothetical protein
MWLISTAEIETLDKLPAIKRRIVQLEKSDNEFLATEGAKEFNELMKIKTT